MKVKIYQEFPVVLSEKEDKNGHYFVASAPVDHISANGKSIAEAKANLAAEYQKHMIIYHEFPESFLELHNFGQALKDDLSKGLKNGATEMKHTIPAYPIQSLNASATNNKLKDNQAVAFATVLVVDADYSKEK